jgi:hypothetical protein
MTLENTAAAYKPLNRQFNWIYEHTRRRHTLSF